MRKALLLAWTVVPCLGLSATAATCIWTGSWDVTPDSADDIVIIRSGANLTWNSSLASNVASWVQEETYTNTVTFDMFFAGATGDTGFNELGISGNCVLSNGTWRWLLADARALAPPALRCYRAADSPHAVLVAGWGAGKTTVRELPGASSWERSWLAQPPLLLKVAEEAGR